MSGILVITGGSRGIGAATARLAAARGHDVCVAFRTKDVGAAAVVSSIESLGRRAIAVRTDVASESDVVDLFTTADQRLGRVTAREAMGGDRS